VSIAPLPYSHEPAFNISLQEIGEELGKLKTSEAAESDHYHTLREVSSILEDDLNEMKGQIAGLQSEVAGLKTEVVVHEKPVKYWYFICYIINDSIGFLQTPTGMFQSPVIHKPRSST
jgi:hypothetical protein